MMARRPEERRLPLRVLLIVIAAMVALVVLFQWNREQQSKDEMEQQGEQLLCEVRAKQAGQGGRCVYDRGSNRWVPETRTSE